MTTERLVSAAACGDRHDKPLSGVLHHDQEHDPVRPRVSTTLPALAGRARNPAQSAISFARRSNKSPRR